MNQTLSKPYGSFCLTMSRSTLESLALISVLVVGAALRFWNITVGLPTLYVHDEIFEVHRALELLRGEYNFYRIKGVFFYLLSFLSGAYGAWLVLQGQFSDLGDFVSYSLVHPGDIILLSRLLCAALGTLSIYLVYRLGKQIFPVDSPGPLVLTLAWATCGLATWTSKWGLIETTVLVFGLLAFFPIFRLFENSSQNMYGLAGLLIAAATATKIYGVLLLLPLVFAHVSAHGGNRKLWRTLFQGKVALALLVFAIALVVLNPAILVKSMEIGEGGGIIPKLSVDTEEIYPLPFYVKHVRWNLGLVGSVLFLIGAATALGRFDKKVCTCAIFAVSFLLALGLRKEAVLIYDRYLLVSLPFFFIVAAYGLEVVWQWAQGLLSMPLKRLAQPMASVAVALAFTWNGATILLANPVMGKPFVPVYQQALEWFEQHVPGGATVVIRGETRPWPGNQSLPIFDLKENYLRVYETKKQAGKTPAEIAYLLDLGMADDVTRYNLVNETRYVIWKRPDEYITQNGAEYFVVDVEYFDGQVGARRSSRATLSRRAFYQRLRESGDVVLLKAFQGYAVTGSPRTIEVYAVVAPHGALTAKKHD